MKNVVIFTANRQRYAVELRWVREIITLGYVTAVPHAPAPVLGATNVHGSIVAVLAIGDSSSPLGPSALLIEADDMSAVLPIAAVDEVVTSRPGTDGTLTDSHGRVVCLLSPRDLLRDAQLLVSASGPGGGA